MSEPHTTTQDEGRGGSIYDLGYRRYDGPRLGRRHAIWALLAHSLRTAYGIGRNTRSKVVPIGLAVVPVGLALLALGILALVSQFGEAGEAIEAISPIRYSTLLPITAVMVFLFCSAQAPELFGRDQLAGVLPLYFSRATSRLDYATARFLGLLIALLVFVLTPQVVLVAGRVMVAADPIEGLADELPNLPPAIVVGLIAATLLGAMSSAIAALTPRRSYATVAIITVFILPGVVAALLVSLDVGVLGDIAVLLSPQDVLDGVNSFIFDVVPDSDTVADAALEGWVYLVAAAAWIVGSLGVLLVRYQRIET